MPKKQTRKLTGGVRILIVDDHASIREGLSSLPSREPGFEVCGDVGTVAASGAAWFATNLPTLAIVDISIGDESGLDLIRRIRESDEKVRVLAWSMFDDLLYAERALGAGAMGYINKRESIRKIVEAIRAINAGDVLSGVNAYEKPNASPQQCRRPADWPKTPQSRRSQIENSKSSG